MSHFFLILAALVSCAFFYFIGFQVGIKKSPLIKQQQADLTLALRLYQTAQATNWAKVQAALGIQVLALTRHYENQFGIPTGTNRFARIFHEAQIAASQEESILVPASSILKQFPAATDAKITVTPQ
jgi:hypothetical protein